MILWFKSPTIFFYVWTKLYAMGGGAKMKPLCGHETINRGDQIRKQFLPRFLLKPQQV